MILHYEQFRLSDLLHAYIPFSVHDRWHYIKLDMDENFCNKPWNKLKFSLKRVLRLLKFREKIYTNNANVISLRGSLFKSIVNSWNLPSQWRECHNFFKNMAQNFSLKAAPIVLPASTDKKLWHFALLSFEYIMKKLRRET